MKLRTGVLVLALGCCLSVISAFGQGGRGTINGSVSDPTGAVVAGAEVRITNTLTGQVLSTTTTSEGHYSLPFLQTGNYTVTATKEGFSSETQTGLILNADQVASANFTLKVGVSTAQVSVEATAAQIDTTTGAVAQVVDQKAIEELPLNGRNPAELVFVAPGSINGSFTNAIALPGSGSGFPQETAASVNGSRMGGVSYQLDGITHMNNYFQTASPFPNPDATQEFRVITNNFDAQYGYTAGAIVSIATRSGTNKWHGGVFEFLRNDKLNASDYFTHQIDPLKRNQFGGSLGGPIIHNKLFIFGNVQITRERVALSSGGVQVPNNRELAGDFSQICAGGFTAGICNDRDADGNVANQLYKSFDDHTAANAYDNNFVDPSTFAPFSVGLEQGIPKTDDPVGNIILTGRSQKNDAYEYTLRGDYNISATQTLNARFFYDNFNRPPFSGDGNYLTGDRSNQAQSTNVSVNHVWTVRPNLLNNFRFGFNRNNSQTINGIDVSPSTLGANLASVSTTIGLVATNGFWITQIPVIQARHNWIVDDTVSFSKGRHSIVAGVNSFSQYSLENATWEADPLMYFNGSVTGNSDADFLLGYLQQVGTAGGEYNQYHTISWAAFGQDSIKLKPNLNINLGVRWEPQTAPRSLQNKMANYFPGQQSVRFPNAPAGIVFPGDPGVPQGGWRDQWNTFLPRISVAWSPGFLPNTSIRSAFAMMVPPYDFSFYNYQGHNAPFSPEHILTYNQVDPGCTLNVMDPFACYSPTGHKDPFPPFAGPDFIPPQDVAFVTPLNLRASFAKDYVPAKEYSWNLSIQHTIGSDLILGVAYIGRHDSELPLPLELNPGRYDASNPAINGTRALSPIYQNIDEYASIGRANYNSVQFSVDKRFSHGVQFTSNFTYSKQLDTSSIATLSNVGSVFDPFNPDASYGISDLNIPRIWNNTFVYQTPNLAMLGKVGSAVLGNWEIAGVWALHSGRPFTIMGGNNPVAIGAGTNNASYSQVGADHANFLSGQSLGVHRGSKSQWLNQYFNTAAFTYNDPGTFGTAPRNLLQGPGYNNADLMFAKNFPFRERFNVQFRWEMFNAFNRTQFNTPDTTYDPAANSTFGRITSTDGHPRLMQAGLKLTF
jgi:Carboxypeptidase regulatory-like domain